MSTQLCVFFCVDAYVVLCDIKDMYARRSFVAKNLRALRTKQHLSMEQLAVAAGLSASAIGGIERKVRTPNLSTLEAIAKALKCTVEELMAS
jgi:DNA-binding XRE family transcriptional regulator